VRATPPGWQDRANQELADSWASCLEVRLGLKKPKQEVISTVSAFDAGKIVKIKSADKVSIIVIFLYDTHN